MQGELDVTSQRQADDSECLRLAGELDLSTVPGLRDAIDQWLARYSRGDLVILLDELTFMDSSGINQLVAAADKLVARGNTLRLVAPSPLIARLFEITRISEVPGIAVDRDR